MSTRQAGQSIIEVIIAVSLFVIIAGSSVIAVLGSLNTSRLAKEETKATFIASEGLEAVQSIKNQDWSSLLKGTHGLVNSSGIWSFSGSSDLDASGKFTRTVSIFEVQRDTNGDIVASGGTPDPETKQVLSSVTWNFTSGRVLTADMTSLLTNWQLSRNFGGISSGPQPEAGSEDCTVFCQSEGHDIGQCVSGAPACTGTNYPSGNRYCNNEAQGATCCCF
jgi:type II secretory pathway pseudopilin PulG